MNITLNSNEDVNITISINRGGAGDATASTESMPGENTAVTETLEALANKAETEVNADYSDCKGFNTRFMGFKTPLPTLGTQLMRKVSLFQSDSRSFVLRYNNYSTIHHAVRRMPIVSAINIDGNPAKRRDNNARKDQWLRDNRIDFDVQLNDSYYAKSGFDKGHMSRREDANWGSTPNMAFVNANMTCMYTNCCPQVPDINRAVFGKNGLWGQLELVILEKGVEAEEGKSTRICVYNGPVFLPADPVYKGVQVPLRFFKVVVWLNGKGEKKTTAFILSQEDLVSDIAFEELLLDEEFKEHQCSIEYLEQLTDMTFTGIRDWDTFVHDGPGSKGVKSLDAQSLESLVSENR